MTKFPADAPKRNVIRALERMGFRVLREKEHNLDGSGQFRRIQDPTHPAEPSAN